MESIYTKHWANREEAGRRVWAREQTWDKYSHPSFHLKILIQCLHYWWIQGCLQHPHLTSSKLHSGNCFLIPSMLRKCWFSWFCLSLLSKCERWNLYQGISSPSFQSCIVPSTIQSFPRLLSITVFFLFFFFWEQKLPALSWRDFPWLINLNTRAWFFVLTQNFQVYFSETGYTKMYFLHCYSLSFLFWSLLRNSLWKGGWQWSPLVPCSSTQPCYSLET